MEILRMDRDRLLRYIAQQLHNTLPDDFDPRGDLQAHLDEALARLKVCINAVRPWRPNQFDPLHSTQYCSFLYFLAHTIWRRTGSTETPTRLFLLNKALNGIDLFYEIEMPPVFFIGHSVGIVFAKATYGNYLVVYQNSTVGKNHGVAPVLGEGVVMYAGTAIIGACQVGDGTVLSQGTSLVNTDSPGHCTVYPGTAGQVVFKPVRRDPLQDIFRR
jgi:serine O-acetyltransferase